MTALDTAPTLADIGEALYGPQWQTTMARELGVSGRIVRYWVAGTHPVPQRALNELCRLMANRRADLAALIERTPA